MPPHGSNPVGEGLILHRMDEQDKKLDVLVELLTGNGDPSKGLVVRVDRIEAHARACQDLPERVQTVEGQMGLVKWLSGTSVTAVLGAMGTWAWTKMTGGHP